MYMTVQHGMSGYFQTVADSSRCRPTTDNVAAIVIRRTWLFTVGDRAFPVAASCLWNNLPRDVSSALTLAVFLTISRSFPP